MLIKRLKKNKNKGFTLVELIIVIAVIAILAVVMTSAFTDVPDRAIKAIVQNSMSTFEQELGTKVSAHTSASCSCGGTGEVYNCPTVYEFIAKKKYTGYCVDASEASNFYVTKDADANAVGATWVDDYAALAKNTGVVVMDNEGALLYAYYCRGTKYFFHAMYSIADGAEGDPTGDENSWALYAAKVADITSHLSTFEVNDTCHAVQAAE